MKNKYIWVILLVIVVVISVLVFNKLSGNDNPSHLYAQMSYEINKANDPIEVIDIMKKYAASDVQPALDKSIGNLSIIKDSNTANYLAFLDYFKSVFSPEHYIKGLQEVSVGQDKIQLNIYVAGPTESYENTSGIINTAYVPTNPNDVPGELDIFVKESGHWKMSTVSQIMLHQTDPAISHLE